MSKTGKRYVLSSISANNLPVINKEEKPQKEKKATSLAEARLKENPLLPTRKDVFQQNVVATSAATKTKNFFETIASYTKKAGISEYQENYNQNLNRYEGFIKITGSIDDIANLEAGSQNIVGNYTNTNFAIDTHYEDLLETKNITVFTGISGSKVALADTVNLYKFKSKFEYNFLIKNYENYLYLQNNLAETALPYFYDVLYSFANSDNYRGFQGTDFFDKPNAVITNSFRNELKTIIAPYAIKLKNKYLRIDKYIENFNPYKEQFPFYTDVVFDTHELDEKSIIQVLNKKDLFVPLMNEVLTGSKTVTLNVSSSENYSQINAKEFDIKNFLYNQLDAASKTDYTFIFELNQAIENKARTFLEVLQNKEEYSEVIAYHLKKYDGTTNSLIQEWILPNTGEGQINWIDSQIKYDKTYTYKLDLIILTFTTNYEITGYEAKNNTYTLNFTNNPLIKIYILQNYKNDSKTTLGASYTNKLLDFPPMEPEIELIPYIGVDNAIKINLNTSTGLKTVPAINFSPQEEARKDELRLAQNKDPNSDLLTFQTDEPSDIIEVYRIENKPKSYTDFFGYKLASLSTNNSAGASFEDSIKPNKKYYYIARCIDYHANISNPTPVYEIEILNDKGLIIPYIKLIEFDKEENKKQPTKSFKRYIKIQPALKHRLVNVDKTNESNIELGSDSVSPWNKKFKLRLTSKTTGKKIDVNFIFKYDLTK